MTDPQVLVSVIIPCYNHGIYLDDAIESVRQSGPAGTEILVVDDGSSDPETLLKLEELEKNGIRVIRKKNGGVASARNVGFEAAKGKYIVPLDADNQLLLPYFSEGVSFLEQNPEVAMVYGDATIFGDKNGTWVNHPVQLEEILFENYIDNCALVRKSAWVSVNGYDEKIPLSTREDWYFWICLLEKGWKFHYINQFCFAYRFLENSKVRTRFSLISNRILVLSYIYQKQEAAIRAFALSSEISEKTADDLIFRLCKQLAYYHFGWGSVAKGYRFLIHGFTNPRQLAETAKLAIGWPWLRYRQRNPLEGGT